LASVGNQQVRDIAGVAGLIFAIFGGLQDKAYADPSGRVIIAALKESETGNRVVFRLRETRGQAINNIRIRFRSEVQDVMK